MAQVRIEHILKRFGAVTAVHDFDVTVKDGEFVSILGPSGCGKTTMLRMIAGFEKASEGEIYIGERLVSSSREKTFVPPEKRDIGMVFQSYAVWPHMTVAENVAYPLKIKKVPQAERRERVQKVLEMVHLEAYAERYPHQLSGGQQQRVALGRALVAEPGLLLLDEPLSNLDAKLRESMRFEIKALQKKLGVTVIYVTHDQAEAMAMSDRIVVMHQGVIQQVAEPMDIYERPANQTVADFIGLVNLLPGEAADGVVRLAAGGEVKQETSCRGAVQVAVRPENISLSRSGGCVQGVLTHRVYLGDAVDYRVQVGDKEVRVIARSDEYGDFGDGETVYLNFAKAMFFSQERC
jgi:iron(III) transport system ATP-binding protein